MSEDVRGAERQRGGRTASGVMVPEARAKLEALLASHLYAGCKAGKSIEVKLKQCIREMSVISENGEQTVRDMLNDNINAGKNTFCLVQPYFVEHVESRFAGVTRDMLRLDLDDFEEAIRNLPPPGLTLAYLDRNALYKPFFTAMEKGFRNAPETESLYSDSSPDTTNFVSPEDATPLPDRFILAANAQYRLEIDLSEIWPNIEKKYFYLLSAHKGTAYWLFPSTGGHEFKGRIEFPVGGKFVVTEPAGEVVRVYGIVTREQLEKDLEGLGARSKMRPLNFDEVEKLMKKLHGIKQTEKIDEPWLAWMYDYRTE